MGKKPLVGVVGTLWLGLSLSGCESCNCNRGTYQGSNGNIRGLVSGAPQQGTQPLPQSGASQTSQGSQAWSSQPKSTTPSWGASTTTPSTGSSAGSVMPTGAVTPPAVNTGGTPVSANTPSWPSTVPTGSAIQQTSATMAPADAPHQAGMVPLDNPVPKGSLMSTSSQRSTDAYGSAGTAIPDGGVRLPPAPPVPTKAIGSTASQAAGAADDSNPALQVAPPPMPAGFGGGSSLPPLPGAGSMTNGALPPVGK